MYVFVLFIYTFLPFQIFLGNTQDFNDKSLGYLFEAGDIVDSKYKHKRTRRSYRYFSHVWIIAIRIQYI